MDSDSAARALDVHVVREREIAQAEVAGDLLERIAERFGALEIAKRSDNGIYTVEHPPPAAQGDGVPSHLEVPQRPSFTAYNIGTGTSYSVRQICDAVENEIGRKLPLRDAPRRTGDPAILCASPTRLMQELGWRPHSSDLHTIIRSALDWKLKNPKGYGPKKESGVVLQR